MRPPFGHTSRTKRKAFHCTAREILIADTQLRRASIDMGMLSNGERGAGKLYSGDMLPETFSAADVKHFTN